MAPPGRNPSNAPTVARLVQETGITESQAWELIALLGPNWSSLIREARAHLGDRKPLGPDAFGLPPQFL
ncbi:hypothetical protein MJ8_29220 [Mesorhizobium sp. J8]|nr:hypothetical protein MJ8_29220 [Mesorhizobium sp. J8]